MKRFTVLVVPLLLAAAPATAPRSFLVAGQPFAISDIIDGRAQPDISGKVSVMISFLPAASKRIAKIMRANKTKPLAVKVDGKRLSPAYAVNGVVLIGGSFTLTEAEALALKISGKPPIPDSFDEP